MKRVSLKIFMLFLLLCTFTVSQVFAAPGTIDLDKTTYSGMGGAGTPFTVSQKVSFNTAVTISSINYKQTYDYSSSYPTTGYPLYAEIYQVNDQTKIASSNTQNFKYNETKELTFSTPIEIQPDVKYLITIVGAGIALSHATYPLEVNSTDNSITMKIDNIGWKYGVSTPFEYEDSHSDYLLPITINYNTTTNETESPPALTATASKNIIDLSWSSVSGATSYNVKRSTTHNGPYFIIGSGITSTTYTDVSVTDGTTYYYVVSALNSSGEGQSSNEASATPQGVEGGERALLTIYLTNGQIKEYDVSAAELDSYLTWYDDRSDGTGPAKYKFIKTYNKGPFKARAEYVIFDKILTFDVDEYDVVTP